MRLTRFELVREAVVAFAFRARLMAGIILAYCTITPVGIDGRRRAN
jgi:hypothetical protein